MSDKSTIEAIERLQGEALATYTFLQAIATTLPRDDQSRVAGVIRNFSKNAAKAFPDASPIAAQAFKARADEVIDLLEGR